MLHSCRSSGISHILTEPYASGVLILNGHECVARLSRYLRNVVLVSDPRTAIFDMPLNHFFVLLRLPNENRGLIDFQYAVSLADVVSEGFCPKNPGSGNARGQAAQPDLCAARRLHA